MTSTRLALSGLVKTRVWEGCSVSRAHKTWSWSLLFKDFRIFAYSSTREQSNKRSGARLKTESETGEGLMLSSISRDVVFFVRRISRDYLRPPPQAPPLSLHFAHKTWNRGNRQHKILFCSHNYWLSTRPGAFSKWLLSPMWGNPDSGIRESFPCGIRNPGLWNP